MGESSDCDDYEQPHLTNEVQVALNGIMDVVTVTRIHMGPHLREDAQAIWQISPLESKRLSPGESSSFFTEDWALLLPSSLVATVMRKAMQNVLRG